jgi:serine/threonine protein kinase/class 3 adenylate cyclase
VSTCLEPGNLLEISTAFTRYATADVEGCRAELWVLHPTWLERVGIENVERQLRLASIVRSPRIRPVLGLDFVRRPPCLVVAASQGQALRDILPGGPRSADWLARLASELADGLEVAHRLGFSLGSMALDDIEFDPASGWRLDITGLRRFGRTHGAVAGDATDAARDAARDAAPGEFVAPEVATGGEPDRSADVYALGSLLAHLLPIILPGSSETAAHLAPLLERCRQIDPDARPSMHDLRTEFQRLFVSSAVTAHSISDAAANAAGNTAADVTEVTIHLDASTTAQPERIDGNAVPVAIRQRIGRYEIQSKLGQGGMGEVYRALDILDGAQVAVKVLGPAYARNRDAIRRLEKEARMLARANNPFVANLLEFNQDGALAYLATEFVSGGTLADQLIVGQPLDERVALAMAADIAHGLSIAHQRGIVHRDLKPENILLTALGRQWIDAARGANNERLFEQLDRERTSDQPLVKVADFGLARLESQSESLAMTREGAIIGTPKYMSPEQCRGETLDVRTDVYSLGVTLFEMLAGHPPFQAETQVALLNQHCHEPHPALRKLRPVLSEATERVVDKCLAKNRDVRYGDADVLRVDLERLLRHEATSIALHPPILRTTGPGVLSYEHCWDLDSSPSQLWPFVSNTDRVNHAMGLPAVTYSTRTDPRHGVERFAETVIAGQRLRWREHPYEWVEGRRFSVLREFARGPFEWFVNVVELEPRSGGGTRLRQRLCVLPKSWLGKWIGRFQLGARSRKGFGETYRRIDRYLAARGNMRAGDDPFGVRTELSSGQRVFLERRLADLEATGVDSLVVARLGQYLQFASDLDVSRIRPLAFARRFGLDERATVDVCLQAARTGLLTLLWDILCPTCQIPANVRETLAAVQSHGECEACNLRFELDFANSVELIFRAHPEIRAVETKTYCIGGPAWSRHVAAQVRLAAGEHFSCELGLEQGSFAIRGPGLPFVVPFRVDASGLESRWDVLVSKPPARREPAILRPGTQVIQLHNDTAVDQQLRIERTAARDDALTAAQASANALFRQLFPAETLSAGQMISLSHIALLLVRLHDVDSLYLAEGDGRAFAIVHEQLEQVRALIRGEGGAIVKMIGAGLQGVFSDPVAAARSGLRLLDRHGTAGRLPRGIAVHAGPVVVTTIDDHLDYFGNTVHQALEMFGRVGPGELWCSDAISSIPEFADALRAAELEVRRGPPFESGRGPTIHVCRLSASAAAASTTA